MLVRRRSFHRNLLGFPNNLPVPIYTPGWREALWEFRVLPKNTTQCARPGLEPGQLAPVTSALAMRIRCKIKHNAQKIIQTPSGIHLHLSSLRIRDCTLHTLHRGSLSIYCLVSFPLFVRRKGNFGFQVLDRQFSRLLVSEHWKTLLFGLSLHF